MGQVVAGPCNRVSGYLTTAPGIVGAGANPKGNVRETGLPRAVTSALSLLLMEWRSKGYATPRRERFVCKGSKLDIGMAKNLRSHGAGIERGMGLV
jgi:hypothetical protein